jgi:hypothetical protein
VCINHLHHISCARLNSPITKEVPEALHGSKARPRVPRVHAVLVFSDEVLCNCNPYLRPCKSFICSNMSIAIPQDPGIQRVCRGMTEHSFCGCSMANAFAVFSGFLRWTDEDRIRVCGRGPKAGKICTYTQVKHSFRSRFRFLILADTAKFYSPSRAVGLPWVCRWLDLEQCGLKYWRLLTSHIP